MIFTEEHIDGIRTGEKTATRRQWDQRRATPGTTYRVTTGADMFVPRSECDCFIRATDVYQQQLGDMSNTDAQAEGDYATVAEFADAWRAINGAWDPSANVWVVEFEYAGGDPIHARIRRQGDYPDPSRGRPLGAISQHQPQYTIRRAASPARSARTGSSLTVRVR